MNKIKIAGYTRELGKPEGWDDTKGNCNALAIRDETEGSNGGYCVMRSAWKPTQEELERLNNGAAVELVVVGSTHPPLRLDVGDARNDGIVPIKNGAVDFGK